MAGRNRDDHAGDQAQRAQIAAWAGVGAGTGAVFGALVGFLTGAPFTLSIVVGALIGGGSVYLGVAVLADRLGAAAGSILVPSGSSTPDRAALSLAESLEARGRHAEAAAEYERISATRPRDPEPCLRLARLHRDRLDRPEDAATWLMRTLQLAADTGVEPLAARELVELLVTRLHAPARALPVLARLAQRHAGTVHGDWAARTLAELRGQVFPD